LVHINVIRYYVTIYLLNRGLVVKKKFILILLSSGFLSGCGEPDLPDCSKVLNVNVKTVNIALGDYLVERCDKGSDVIAKTIWAGLGGPNLTKDERLELEEDVRDSGGEALFTSCLNNAKNEVLTHMKVCAASQ